MKPPPPMLDNARILSGAWSSEEPFGFCGDVPTYGFAAYRYDSGKLYRFNCDRDWETVNDSDYDDEESAKRSIPANHQPSGNHIVWH